MDGGKPTAAPAWMLAATAGSSLVGGVVGGIVLDLQFGWSPWATLVGLVIGIVSCLSILVRAANRSREEP